MYVDDSFERSLSDPSAQDSIFGPSMETMTVALHLLQFSRSHLVHRASQLLAPHVCSGTVRPLLEEDLPSYCRHEPARQGTARNPSA